MDVRVTGTTLYAEEELTGTGGAVGDGAGCLVGRGLVAMYSASL